MATKKSGLKANDKRLSQLKKMLEEEHQLVISKIHKHSLESIDSHGDLVDQSTDLSEREQLMGLEQRDRQRLLDIDSAIKKIEEGDYGVCEDTGNPIPIERLRAIPSTTLTIEAKEKRERQEYI
jgi:RNA polymerase-binding transcription factor